MTEAQARAILAAHSYVPGVSTTLNIQGEARTQIKEACRVLKRSAAPEPSIHQPVAVPTKQPRPSQPDRKGGE